MTRLLAARNAIRRRVTMLVRAGLNAVARRIVQSVVDGLRERDDRIC